MAVDLAASADRPAGPQMIADFAGERSTGPFDPGTTFVAYQGKTPDYVLGSDWKKALAWPDEKVAVTRPSRDAAPTADDNAADAPDDAPVLTRVAYNDAPAPAHSYPSLGGAPPEAAEADAPVAPEPPQD
ncbi:hypothetical protein [Phenylobacterium sp.]|uniref:hypothetical protein n=1 Tax=Phenylobacterium sp. TaxID=1871053 RepID=UPI0011FA06D1|nr:hypothetical protein [Phenylobacterium sp.]THD62291.1 MAG: hypothetical protein E8A49_08500 [Phenylobacterium sp.]